MQVKTSELTGAALDWAVAKAEGYIDSDEVRIYPYRSYDEFSSPIGFNPSLDVYYCNDYRPSTNWAQGGPIIERESITVSRDGGMCDAYKREFLFEEDGRDAYQTGPTMLVAAMRCFVASKMGDMVDVPDSLGE